MAEFEKLNPEGTISDFLENVALITDVDNLNQTTGAVTLMTLHSAKGLEFDAVFLVGMEEGVFPLSRALFDETALEEERRLAYVGITRAKKKLYISHAHTRMLYNARSANQLSRFVGEIPPRLIQEGAARAQTRVPRPMGRPTVENPAAPSYRYAKTGAQDDVRFMRGGSGAAAQGAPRYRSDASASPAQNPARPGGALNIPGLQKGFGRGAASAGEAPRHGLSLFRTGDRVVHAVFGMGEVIAVEEEGQKVSVAFESGARKRFSANIAPLRKVEK